MKLSKDIQSIFSTKDGKTSIRQILSRVDQKSYGLLLIIMSLPSALPVPAPGYSTPFAIVIFIIARDIVLNRSHPKLPKRVMDKEIKTKKDSKLVGAMVKFISFFEKFVKPRFVKMYKGSWFKRILGAVVLLCAISMSIPIPLTNTIPAAGIFLMGMGMMEEDVVFSVLGIVTALVGIAITTTILVLFISYGPEAVGMVSDWLSNLFNFL